MSRDDEVIGSPTPQDDSSVKLFFKIVATEVIALFEHRSFEFLTDFDLFIPTEAGQMCNHEPPALIHDFLQYYYRVIYGSRPVERELQTTVILLNCGFD